MVCSTAANKRPHPLSWPVVQMPPSAWVSAVLGQLHHSVDVDSVEPYTLLFQECVVLQPALLHMPPQQAGVCQGGRGCCVWGGGECVVCCSMHCLLCSTQNRALAQDRGLQPAGGYPDPGLCDVATCTAEHVTTTSRCGWCRSMLHSKVVRAAPLHMPP